MGGLYSVNRIIANDRSAAREAALVASAQRASTDLRLIAESRQGHGQVTLTGPYTGAADTAVEVEVLSGTGSTLRPSRPVINGVGSGALSVLSVDAGAVPETVTLKLVSAGTPATHAELPFFGVTLRAKVAGPAGNAIELTVTRRLTATETDYATLEEIPAGTTALEGAQWDWGAVPGDGSQIPVLAPRLKFKGHPQVFRHWRAWEDGIWVCHMDPPTAAAVAADTRVMAVTGDYLLRIGNGTTAEEYAAVTVYDAVRQIKTRSALLDVVGVVADDRAPGGMGVTDIPLRTDAYSLPVEAHIQGAYGVPRLDGVSVGAGAATESFKIERVSGGGWTVTGSVSGSLPNAKTGVPYASAQVGFAIPKASVPEAERAAITADVRYVSRPADVGKPGICVYPKLGPAGVPKVITYVYTKRPAKDCPCESLPAPPVSDYCLGITEGEDAVSLPPAVASRVAGVYAWRESFVRANTRWVGGNDEYTEYVGAKPAEPGEYRVRLTGSGIYYVAETQFAVVLSGVSTDVFATSTEASNWAAAAEAYDGGQPIINGNYVTVGGRTFAVTQWPSGIGWSWSVDTAWPSWSTQVETLRAPVAAVPGDPVVHPAVEPGWEGATAELAVMDGVLGILIPCLSAVYQDAGALSSWDSLWAEAAAEMDAHLLASSGEDGRLLNADWLRRYSAACDNIRIAAGVYPFDLASSEAGACWQDDPQATHWWVDAAGEYLPAFTHLGYVSALRVGGKIISTHEFGFSMAIGCEDGLMEGDSIVITVRGASQDGYSPGDWYRLPIVAATSAKWGGGEDGDDTHIWTVGGASTGAWDDWSWSPSAPSPYSGGLVGLAMTAGGIPYAVGDQWAFGLEGGQFRWRRDGGAWSTRDLFGAAPSLGDGLALTILGGAAPSFVAGDSWTFSALATHGPERLRSPREGRAWTFDGAAATLDLDLGTVQPIEAVLIALHTLPSVAGITISGGNAAANEWTFSGTWRAGPILCVTPDGTTARYLRLSLTNCGAGASVGWFWAGAPWSPLAGVSAMDHVRQYGLTRTGGRNPAALYRGRGTGGRWAWNLDAGGALLPDDVDGLLALLDHVAEQGLEWVCLVPDVRAPESATLAQIDADAVTLTEHLGWLHEGQSLTSVELPFRAVLA